MCHFLQKGSAAGDWMWIAGFIGGEILPDKENKNLKGQGRIEYW